MISNSSVKSAHVLGAAEPDALGAELERDARVVGRIRIGAHAQHPHLIGPAHEGGELARQCGLDHRHAAEQNLTGRAVDGDDIALLQQLPGNRHRAGRVIDPQRAGARYAWLAHAARDHRRMGGHAAPGGEDALRRMHAVDVLGRGLDADQDHVAALRLEGFGILGGEHDLARRGARRGRQPGRQDLALGIGIDGGM
jgi:hypothetical protein